MLTCKWAITYNNEDITCLWVKYYTDTCFWTYYILPPIYWNLYQYTLFFFFKNNSLHCKNQRMYMIFVLVLFLLVFFENMKTYLLKIILPKFSQVLWIIYHNEVWQQVYALFRKCQGSAATLNQLEYCNQYGNQYSNQYGSRIL